MWFNDCSPIEDVVDKSIMQYWCWPKAAKSSTRAQLQVAIWRQSIIAAEPAWHGSTHTQMDKKTRATFVDNVTLAPDEILKMIKCSCDSDMPCKSKRLYMNVTMPTWLVLHVAHGKEEMGVSVRTPESTFRQNMLMRWYKWWRERWDRYWWWLIWAYQYDYD